MIQRKFVVVILLYPNCVAINSTYLPFVGVQSAIKHIFPHFNFIYINYYLTLTYSIFSGHSVFNIFIYTVIYSSRVHRNFTSVV